MTWCGGCEMILRAGYDNFRHHLALWGWLYLTKLTLTLVVTIPFLILVDASLTSSFFARSLLKAWSFDVLIELFSARENILSSFFVILLFYTLLVFLFKQFLNGGIYHTYLSHSPVKAREFMAEAVSGFGGHIKISLVMGLFYVFLFAVGFTLAGFIPSDLFGNFGATSLYGSFLKLFILSLVLIIGGIISEMLRLRVTIFPDENIQLALRNVFTLYIIRIVKYYGIYLICLLPFLVVWLVMEKMALVVTAGMGNTLGVILELIFFQIAALLKVGQSLYFTATVAPDFRQLAPGRYDAITQGELGLD